MKASTKVRVGLLVAVVAAWCAVAAPLALATPGNDDYANRTVLSGALPLQAVGSNVGAGKEGGEYLYEPFYQPAGRSVWFSWTAVSTGWVTASTCGSDFDTLLNVYAGASLQFLERVGNRGGAGACAAGGEQITFKAVAGSSYEIRVDGDLSPQPPDPIEGTIALQLAPAPHPDNDDFADARQVPTERLEDGAFFRVDQPGFNWNATKEAGEPAHAGDLGGASVWYSWTAPVDGRAKIVVVSGAFESSLGNHDGGRIGVYTGDSLTGLTAVGAPAYFPNEAALDAVAGTTYKIAVDGRRDPLSGEALMGAFTFLIYETPANPSRPPAVDSTAPQTTLSKRRVRPAQRSATFRFRSNELGVFRCKLDARKSARCGSPQTYRKLTPGAHTFRVFAIDASGNLDASPALARFTIPDARSRG